MRRKWPMIFGVLLLGVLCVGGMELLACRVADPDLYYEITDPVYQKAHSAWDALCQSATSLWQSAAQSAEALRQDLEEALTPPPAPDTDFETQLSQPELAPPKEMLDPLITDLIQEGGQERLTGGGVEVVYYNQTDDSRAAQMYGTDPLSSHGCGPTAMAIAVSTLTEEVVDPEDMAAYCVQEGYWCKSHGSYLSIVPGVASDYGLDCTPLDPAALDEDALYSALASGDLAVALMGKGHFTKKGHFIVLRGVTLGGEILVADPASRERSLIPWDLSLIVEELSASRSDGAPLWLLSLPEEAAE